MITEDCDDTDNAAAEFTFTKQNFVTNLKLIQRCFVQTQKTWQWYFEYFWNVSQTASCFPQKKSILQICQRRVGGWLHERLICCIEDLRLPLGWEALNEGTEIFINTDSETLFCDQHFWDWYQNFFWRPKFLILRRCFWERYQYSKKMEWSHKNLDFR